MRCINAAGLFDSLHSRSRRGNIMSIWRAMRKRREYKELYDKYYGAKQDAFEHQCLNEFTGLCRIGNQEQLQLLQREQLKGYIKWRKRNSSASPLDFFDK